MLILHHSDCPYCYPSKVLVYPYIMEIVKKCDSFKDYLSLKDLKTIEQAFHDRGLDISNNVI